MTARLILDVTSLMLWSGPATGIPRVEHALATTALRRPATVLACYDSDVGGLRALDPAWHKVLLSWSAMLDPVIPRRRRTGLRRFVPGRQLAVDALERLRLTATRPEVAWAAGLAQRGILGIRPHGFKLHDAEGARFAHVPRDLGLAEEIKPRAGDALLNAGNGWFHSDLSCLRAMREAGVATTVLCYDLIPITHPQFYDPPVAMLFRDYWRGVMPLLDQVIVTAACIGDDVRRFCRTERLAIPKIKRLPLGFDDPETGHSLPELPCGLRPGAYALYVSTIEPRKGHAMLLKAWKRLLARGTPQRSGFRLVFVGRPGWMVDDVLTALAEQAPFGGTVLHLEGVGERVLDRLYADAAFCLYPSVYEGFGLPVIEAFARHKPVIASDGGALPETVGALGPCLDPLDDVAWAAAMGSWIEAPGERAVFTDRIRAGFIHQRWESAAAGILDAAANAGEGVA